MTAYRTHMLQQRRSARQVIAAQRKDAFWGQRYAGAQYPRTFAAVAWDRLRSEVNDAPRGQKDVTQSEAWRFVAERLEDLRLDVRNRYGMAPNLSAPQPPVFVAPVRRWWRW